MAHRLLLAAVRVGRVALQLALGVTLGLIGLEAVLRANPGLLLHGMALPAPVDPPLTVQIYDVRYSDADLFFWHADLIRPVPPESDRLEARVRFETDEFGFPNPSPLPPEVDVVVLGRSFSLGAQAEPPWPRRLAAQTGLTVLNLSQAGSGLDTKAGYLEHFGWGRQPKWVILDVLPSMDILGYDTSSPWLIENLPSPLIQYFARQAQVRPTSAPPANPIYPLAVDVPSGTARLTFFSYYLAALTVDEPALAASRQWAGYRQAVRALAQQTQAHSACLALLYVPTKEEIYFSLAVQPAQLAPALTGWLPWQLDSQGWLAQTPGAAADPAVMQANAAVARRLVADFASQAGLIWIDPTDRLTEAARAGQTPFMAYDSHWSALGNALVAQAVADMLGEAGCP